jgi:hypothetical protein
VGALDGAARAVAWSDRTLKWFCAAELAHAVCAAGPPPFVHSPFLLPFLRPLLFVRSVEGTEAAVGANCDGPLLLRAIQHHNGVHLSRRCRQPCSSTTTRMSVGHLFLRLHSSQQRGRAPLAGHRALSSVRCNDASQSGIELCPHAGRDVLA